MISQTFGESRSTKKSTLREVSKGSQIQVSCSNSEYLALATVTAFLFQHTQRKKSAQSCSLINEQSKPSQVPLSILSPFVAFASLLEIKELKLRKKKKKSGRGRTFHKCVIWTGIIASPSRLIFKYTWVRNNSTPQSSCGHTVYSPFWLKSLFLCQQFLMQNHLNVC